MNFKNVNKVSKTISLSKQLDTLLDGRKFEQLSSDEQNLYNVLQAKIEYLQAKINGNFKTRREKKRKLKVAQKEYETGLFANKFTAEELNELANQTYIRYNKRVVKYTIIGLSSFLLAFGFALFTLTNLPVLSVLLASLPILISGVANTVDFYSTEHTFKKLKHLAKQKGHTVDNNKIENDVSLLTNANKVEVVKKLYESVPTNKKFEIENLIKHMIELNKEKQNQSYSDFEAEQTRIKLPADLNEDTQLNIENFEK